MAQDNNYQDWMDPVESVQSVMNESAYAPTTTESVDKVTSEKLGRLEEKDRNLLKENPDIANINYKSGDELQTELSNAVNQQVYRRDDGSKYQMLQDANGRFVEVDYSGETENLYIDNTVDGNMKLGLANPEAGFTGRYDPNSPEAKAVTASARAKGYKNRDGSPYTYGWAPGPKGVTTKDGALLDIELPKDVATKLEYLVHSNKGQILNRAIGIDGVTDKDRADYGSGKTEYTKPTAPLWDNRVGYDKNAQLLPDTPMPKIPKGYVAPERVKTAADIAAEEVERYKRNQEIANYNKTIVGRVLDETANTAKGIVSGIATGAVDLANAAGELVTWIPQEAWNAAFDADTDWGLMPDEWHKALNKGIESAVGYNSERAQVDFEIATMELNSMGVDITDPSTFKNIDWSKLSSASKMIISNPSMIANGIATIVGGGFGLGLGAKAVTKTGASKLIASKIGERNAKAIGGILDTKVAKSNRIKSKILASKTMDKAAKASKIKAVESKIKVWQKLEYYLKGTSMTNADLLVRMNNDIEEYRKNNNGEDPSAAKLLGMVVLDKVAAELQGQLIKSMLMPNGKLKEEAKNSLMGKIMSTAGAITNLPKEALQEMGDGVVEIINQKFMSEKYKDKTIKELLSDASAEIISQGIAGAAGGALMTTTGVAKSKVSEGIGNILDRDGSKDKFSGNTDNTERVQVSTEDKRAKLKMALDGMTENKDGYTPFNSEEDLNIVQGLVQDFIDTTPDDDITTEDVELQKEILLKVQTSRNAIREKKAAAAASRITENTTKEDLENILNDKDEETRAMILANYVTTQYAGGLSLDGFTDINDEAASKATPESIAAMMKDQQQGSVDDAIDDKLRRATVDGDGNPIAQESEATASSTTESETKTTANSNKGKARDVGSIPAKTIMKLASKFKIPAEKLALALEDSMADRIITNAKSIGKEANVQQYKDYFSAEGLIQLYAKYKAALQLNDRDTAIEAATAIQTKGFNAERRLRRFETTYNEMKQKLQMYINDMIEVGKTANISEVEATKMAIEQFQKKYPYVVPASGGFKLGAKNVAKDLNLNPEVRKSLGFKDGDVSTVSKLIALIEELVDNTDALLANSGLPRRKYEGVVTDAKDIIPKLQEKVDKLLESIKMLEGNDTQIAKDIIESKQEAINKLKEEIEEKNKLDKYSRSARYSPIDKFGNIDEVIADVKELEAKDTSKMDEKRLEEHKTKLKEAKDLVAEYDTETATKTHVEKNAGKKVGNAEEGKQVNKEKLDKIKTLETKISEAKPDEDTTEAEAELAKLKERTGEVVEEDYTPAVTKVEAVEKVARIKEAKQEIDDTKASSNSLYDKRIKSIQKLKDQIASMTSEDVVNSILENEKAIEIANRGLKEAKKSLEILEKRKKGIVKSISKALSARKAKLDKSEEALDEVKSQKLFNALIGAGEKANEEHDGEVTKEAAKKWFAEYKKTADKILLATKGMHNILFKVASIVSNSKLNREIGRLKNQIKKLEKKKERAERKTERILAKHSKEDSAEIRKKLKKIRARKDAIRKSGKITKEKISKLHSEINKLRDELIGTTIIDNVIHNTITEADIKSKSNGNGSIDTVLGQQPVDIAEYFDTNKTLLGNVDIQELLELVDNSDGSRDYLKELLEEGRSISLIEKVLGTSAGKRYKTKDGAERESRLYAVKNNPFNALLYDANGNMNEHVANMIAIVALNWVGTKASSNNWNTDAEIANMIQKLEFDVTPEQKNLLRTAGSMRKVVALELGTQLLRTMGLKDSGNVPAEAFYKMASGAGLYVLSYMSGAGYIKKLDDEEQHIKGDVWNKVVHESDTIGDPNSKLLMDKDASVLMVQTANVGKSPEDLAAEFEAKLKGEVVSKETMYTKIGRAMKDLEDGLDIDELSRNYLTKPHKGSDEYYSKVKGSYFYTPEEQKRVMKIAENTEYGAVEGINEMIEEIYGTGYEGRMAYLKSVGWKDTAKMKEDGELFDVIESQEGKNRELEQEYDSYIEMQDRIKSKKMRNSIWFKWFFTKGGRFTLDSTKVNPQNNKLLHRWAVLPKKSQRNEFDMNNKKEFIYFKLAMAQGLGYDVDKSYVTNSDREKGLSIGGKDGVPTEVAADIVMNGGNEHIDGIKKALREGSEYVIDIQSGEYKGYKIKFKPEHPGHTAQAIIALGKYKAAKKSGASKFVATMVAEFDSITSGFANKILQDPTIENVEEYGRKTGMFILGSELPEGLSMNGFIATGKSPDGYKTLSSDVGSLKLGNTKVIDAVWFKDEETGHVKQSAEATKMLMDMKSVDEESVPSLVDDNNIVTSEGRKMFKYPFMIFNYAASINTIKRNIANDMAINVIDRINKGKFDDALDGEFMKGIGLDSKNALDMFKIKIREESVTNTAEFRKISMLFNNSYGMATESVMNSKFGKYSSMNEAIINSTKLMFDIFIDVFKERVSSIESDKGSPMSLKELKDLVIELRDVFPMIKGPLSESTLDSMAIIDSKLADNKDIKLGSSSVQLKEGNETLAATMVREFKKAHAFGAVIGYHWIDATIIRVMLANGNLGIHDATIIGENFEEQIKMLNKAAYDVGRNYSIVGETLDSLVNVIDNSGITSEKLAGMMVDTGLGKENGVSGLHILNTMMNRAKEVMEARSEVYGEVGSTTIANFAGPAGSEYIVKSVDVDTLIDDKVAGSVRTTLKDKLATILEDVMNKENC